jgi:hypothetical protein
MRSHPSTKANRDTPLVFLLMFFAFASSALAQAEEELIRGAKKEGKVVFWSSMRVEDSKALVAGFETKYPLSRSIFFAPAVSNSSIALLQNSLRGKSPVM